jgi:proteasome lid subunit RPN8/RPN11
MIKLTDKIKAEALAHAKEEFPKECVGLVAVVKGRKRYFKCTNKSEEPEEHFSLDAGEYADVEDKGEIIAVIHSHPKTNHAPSAADRVACEKSGLPWFVVNPNTEFWGECEPSGFELPYVGREFVHGVVDCYTLCRDWYQKEWGLKMNDYVREDDWWKKGANMYLDNFQKEGFHEISTEDFQIGDAFLMQIDSDVPNHAAVYIGDNLILHHVHGRLSSRDVYKFGGYYHKATAKVLRHESR